MYVTGSDAVCENLVADTVNAESVLAVADTISDFSSQ